MQAAAAAAVNLGLLLAAIETEKGPGRAGNP